MEKIFKEKNMEKREKVLVSIKRGLSNAINQIKIDEFKKLVKQLNEMIYTRLQSETKIIQETIIDLERAKEQLLPLFAESV
jgi:hypothetical protein